MGEPTIREVTPTAGPVGSRVTIMGVNLGKAGEGRVVSFNSVVAEEVDVEEESASAAASTKKDADKKDAEKKKAVVKQPGDVAAQTQGEATNLSSGLPPIERGESEHGVAGGVSGATVTHKAGPVSEEETIVVTVPEGATPGDVVVTVGGVSSNGSRFTVVAG